VSSQYVSAADQARSNVRKSIIEFERRSSISGVGIESSSLATKNAPPIASSASSAQKASASAAAQSNQQQQMRMSKSCFEVDVCDNSSSGVSSDVDGDAYGQSHAHNHGMKESAMREHEDKQQQQILTRTNSAQV